MTDPLRDLLDELLDAHDRVRRSEQPEPHTPVGRLRAAVRDRLHAPRRRRRRLAVVAAVALTATASAAAAVVIATQNSAPLVGRLPQLLGSRYALRVIPDLQVGHAGWCVSLVDLRAHGQVVPIPPGCVGGSGPDIASGGLAVIDPRSAAMQSWLLYAIVDRRVAALQAPDGTRIRPVANRLLPPGWRAAVTISNPAAVVGRSTVVELIPLSPDGRALSPRHAQPLILPSRITGAGSPRGCRARVPAAGDLRVGAARASRLPRSLPSAAFLTCYGLSLEIGGRPSQVSVLVSAARPHATAPAIPGFLPLRGHPGVWVGPHVTVTTSAGGSLERLYARRAGGAWLLIQTAAPTPVALSVLRRTRASG